MGGLIGRIRRFLPFMAGSQHHAKKNERSRFEAIFHQ
jgi:hypothetical protein